MAYAPWESQTDDGYTVVLPESAVEDGVDERPIDWDDEAAFLAALDRYHDSFFEPFHGDEDETPRCDICGEAQHLGEPQDDWNGDTGCHLSCEAEAGYTGLATVEFPHAVEHKCEWCGNTVATGTDMDAAVAAMVNHLDGECEAFEPLDPDNFFGELLG